MIANETCAGASVVQEVKYRADDGAEVIVVAPQLAGSRLGHWMGARSAKDRAAAESRLADSVAALGDSGLSARGHLGDSDPLQALDDALRLYEPDEVIISTHPPARSNWLERDVVRRARSRYRVPITHVVVDLEHESVVSDAEGAPQSASAEALVRVYHEATYESAIAIRRSGFADERREAGAGVLVSERPAEAREAGDDPVLFAVDVPASGLGGREVDVGGVSEGRLFLLPADLLNAHGPPIAVGDWSE